MFDVVGVLLVYYRNALFVLFNKKGIVLNQQEICMKQLGRDM